MLCRITNTVPGINGLTNDIDLTHQSSLNTMASHQVDYIIYTSRPANGGARQRAWQHLSLEDPQSSLKWLLPSKPKGDRSPVPTRRKQVPWSQHYPGPPPMLAIFQWPYSFAQITNHYVTLSYHQIFVPLQFTIPLTSPRLPSSFNGSLAILTFQVMN